MFRRSLRCLIAGPFKLREEGTRFEHGWKGFLQTANNVEASPWHDIDLVAPSTGHVFHYVNEIPKGTREKLEVNLTEAGNPIKQDIKKGKLRLFTYGDIPFNYGCLPQTWEDPSSPDPQTGNKGDGDPLDVVLLTDRVVGIGEVLKVRVAGTLAMIDEGETDWKILAVIDGEDVAASAEVVDPIRHWFRYYKTTDGKGENTFAFDGSLLGPDQALRVIEECANGYQHLIARKHAKAADYALPALKH